MPPRQHGILPGALAGVGCRGNRRCANSWGPAPRPRRQHVDVDGLPGASQGSVEPGTPGDLEGHLRHLPKGAAARSGLCSIRPTWRTKTWSPQFAGTVQRDRLTMPPSMKCSPSIVMGGKTPGSAELAMTAGSRSPAENHTSALRSMLATAPEGHGEILEPLRQVLLQSRLQRFGGVHGHPDDRASASSRCRMGAANGPLEPRSTRSRPYARSWPPRDRAPPSPVDGADGCTHDQVRHDPAVEQGSQHPHLGGAEQPAAAQDERSDLPTARCGQSRADAFVRIGSR